MFQETVCQLQHLRAGCPGNENTEGRQEDTERGIHHKGTKDAEVGEWELVKDHRAQCYPVAESEFTYDRATINPPPNLCFLRAFVVNSPLCVLPRPSALSCPRSRSLSLLDHSVRQIVLPVSTWRKMSGQNRTYFFHTVNQCFRKFASLQGGLHCLHDTAPEVIPTLCMDSSVAQDRKLMGNRSYIKQDRVP